LKKSKTVVRKWPIKP